MKKILIIGQALPAIKQAVPYDTTMLYDWLSVCSISKEDAQNLFEFEAVCGHFPGFEKGGHATPSIEDMNNHWNAVLNDKVNQSDKIWVLGNVAKEFLSTKNLSGKYIIYTIHPSKRNYSLFQKNKDVIISSIKFFLFK